MKPKKKVDNGLNETQIRAIIREELKARRPDFSGRKSVVIITIVIALIGAVTGIIGLWNDRKYDKPMCRIVDTGCSSGMYKSPNKTAIILSCIIMNDGKRPLFRKSISAFLKFPDKILKTDIMEMPEEFTGIKEGGTITYTNKKDLTKVENIPATESVSGDLLMIADVPYSDFYMKEVSIELVFTSGRGTKYSFEFPIDFSKGNSMDKNLKFPNSTQVITQDTTIHFGK